MKPNDPTEVDVIKDPKQGLQLGVHLPLPWLLTIVGTLLFNAGIVYTQFNDIKSTQSKQDSLVTTLSKVQTETTNRVDLISERISQGDARSNNVDARLLDHETRIRAVERVKR